MGNLLYLFLGLGITIFGIISFTLYSIIRLLLEGYMFRINTLGMMAIGFLSFIPASIITIVIMFVITAVFCPICFGFMP
ncbi:MAG: hypothetical protein LBV74_08395 [Tannerella sp.]|nr:hypothetical protein [Tannerella sp.]